MDLQGLDLERIKEHVLGLGKIDYAWWRIGLLAVLILIGGALAWVSLRDVPEATGAIILVLLYALAMTIAGFNIYALLSRRDEQRMRLELLLESLAKEVERLSSIYDPITRVYNRQFLEELLAKEITRSERFRKSFSLMVIDLNDFKGINDHLGHLMGDFVLAEMGQILRACVRGCDYVFRYGGDEFLVVLAETDLVGAEVVVRRLHQRIEHWNESNKVANINLSVSLGTSIYSEGRKVTDMINEADQAMYANKRARRAAAAESQVVH